MFSRIAAKRARSLLKIYPILWIMGPRQSGKTTLARTTFADYDYYSLEDLDVRLQASEDPRGFLNRNSRGMIIDEAQYVPELFSYLQTIVDEKKKMGEYILTGSQNFLLFEKISQSLTGRAGIIQLLPFSLEELKNFNRQNDDIDSWIYSGFYPPIYDRGMLPTDFYPQYIQTYVDRDVRTIQNVTDLSAFQKFVKLCAGRIGGLLNINNLAQESGVAFNTAKAWLSVLETSYIIFMLQPHHVNFNKRLVKQPKLFFYDTGLACSLLGITHSKQLQTHYLRGYLFENLVIAEYLKSRVNVGLTSNAYFWRDHTGNEVDLLVEEANQNIPIEIKSAETLNPSFYDGLQHYCKLAQLNAKHAKLIYGGDKTFNSEKGQTISWKVLKDGFIVS